ncbi:hypothetical protein V5J73_03590 [Flavobacterium sp. KS-LB2]|uniref:hypothetical protein n=1 Tax=Flavobacterium sp. KS-LB2 TaxID=3120525 RepID=UPI0030D2D724
MNGIYSYSEELIDITKKNQNFSLTENTLTVTEKNNITTIALNKISSVRITKHRVLYINYFCVILIIITFHTFEKFIDVTYASLFILNVIKLIAIFISFTIKKYMHAVLINTTDLNFKRFKINGIKKVDFSRSLKTKTRNQLSHKVLSKV